ncbi:hypothetical protein C4J81_14850 [Deltaproteobacteria bacterium Smac51]|nr:hypothetical protein C4J81_14850 [Deltaproteobacteria bacterium Smac51]
MADKPKTSMPAEADEKPFDRQAYLKEVRQELLANLGLPKDTKPEQVARLIQIKSDMAKINDKKK